MPPPPSKGMAMMKSMADTAPSKKEASKSMASGGMADTAPSKKEANKSMASGGGIFARLFGGSKAKKSSPAP
eukprot:CAMPEP_0176368600 /NCGR_PEP_ID=MMETSP0126-20121128/22713_1 /TAXON_ID=141414 ORGANISM="Strombidinopsis acuminatum, Strain SPMC142" /NCGR_SAMPLE_ID=MMETSP0126 /ASSEMBLY_ACC=CAM_ASM_000229 /LENGTH=71 /DNA_ID=CAMNT_0017726925 /DNA_START=1654 /DNA_END=1872 /DNA_ORIENTATION=+